MDQEALDRKRQIKDLQRKVLIGWNLAIKNGRLYKKDHPSFALGAQQFASSFLDIFRNTMELSVQHTEGLFRIEDEIFLEESLIMYDLLHILETGKISRVLFLPGVTPEETAKLVSYMMELKTPSAESTPFVSEHIRVFPDTGIHVNLNEKQRTFARINENLKLIQHWRGLTEALFTRIIDEQSFFVSELSEPLDMLIDAIHRNPSLFSIGLTLKSEGSLHINHAVATMIYSIYIGQLIGYDLSVLKILALSALFHDIGRQFLPSDFSTGVKLGSTDLELVTLHPRDGSSFLSGVQGLPLAVARVAMEHHVGFDGSGYPTLPGGLKPHVFSQIVGLADFVSWQSISENFYHRPVAFSKLVRCLLRRTGTQFNPVMVKLFIPFLGLFPPGTRVQLNSGEHAICLEPNVRNISRPAIAINDKTYKWMSQLADAGAPYPTMIEKVLGHDPDFEKLLPLIPNLFQTNS